jgi:hypothetical protein
MCRSARRSADPRCPRLGRDLLVDADHLVGSAKALFGRSVLIEAFAEAKLVSLAGVIAITSRMCQP